jgi:hypothetical protein
LHDRLVARQADFIAARRGNVELVKGPNFSTQRRTVTDR